VFSVGEAFRGAPAWLLITAAATIVLVRQMGRVEDRWPRRNPQRRASATRTPPRVARPKEQR
jgi:hypothetical protein